MKKGLKTIAILLILLCSISVSAYARGDGPGKVGIGSGVNMSDNVSLGVRENISDKTELGPRLNGFTNLINSKIGLLETEIDNSDDLSVIEEAVVMSFELQNIRNEMQQASNEDEFASSLNKFNSIMEDSSEDLEHILVGDQKMSADRTVDVRNTSVPMNNIKNASDDMKSFIQGDESGYKNVSSRSKIGNEDENKTSPSNSNFLASFVTKIMSFFE
ncbi:hypothetical protein HNV12_19945 [Methanococcoides sp. SA1]|nr:hypothetical protein [Methanococcoides sp. SA1]